MSSDSGEQVVGAIVSLTPPKEGDNVWLAEQTEIVRNLPPGDAPGRRSIDWSWGPIKITGYIDTNSFEIGVTVTVVGVNVGSIFGNLKDGVGLKINLFVVKGEIKLYLKNGNEIWVHVDVKVTFDGSYSGDYKILTI